MPFYSKFLLCSSGLIHLGHWNHLIVFWTTVDANLVGDTYIYKTHANSLQFLHAYLDVKLVDFAWSSHFLN